MAKEVTIIPPKPKPPVRKRVGIYCRVSKATSAQIHSLAAQASFLLRYVMTVPGWIAEDIYIDICSGATIMAENKTLNDQELENVNGGECRVVNTGDSRNAAIRVYPGLNTEIIGSLPNGTVANTTGRFMRADGRNWAEINYPMWGWIKGSILGYEY